MASGIDPPIKLRWSSEVSSVAGNGDMSQASITSSPIGLATIRDCGLQLKWSGGTGTLTIEVSNNAVQRHPTDAFASVNTGDWVTLTLDRAITQPAGSASGDVIDLSEIPFRWARVKYTRSAGSGTLEGWASGKAA